MQVCTAGQRVLSSAGKSCIRDHNIIVRQWPSRSVMEGLNGLPTGTFGFQVHHHSQTYYVSNYSLHELDCCWFHIWISVAQDFSSKGIIGMTQQVSNAMVVLEKDSTDAWLKPSCLSFILPSSTRVKVYRSTSAWAGLQSRVRTF